MKMTQKILKVIYFFYNNIVVFDKNKKIDYLVILFGIIYLLHNTEILVLNTDFIIKPLLSLVIDRVIARFIIKIINLENYLKTNIKYFSNPNINLISEYIILLFKILVLPSILYRLYFICLKDLSYNLIIISIIPYLLIAFYINSIQKK